MVDFPGHIGLDFGPLGRGFGEKPDVSIPVISSSVTGTNVVITVSGEAGATHFLQYIGNQSAWQSGGNRAGDGNFAAVILEYDIIYVFMAFSQLTSGIYTPPSIPQTVKIAPIIPNNFDAALPDEAIQFLAEFGESIIYLPASGGSRNITAIVERLESKALPAAGHGNTPQNTIMVANNLTIGVSSSEFDGGGDKVTLALRIGQTAGNHRITKIISQDAGMMTLEVL